VDLETARAELRTAHAAIVSEYPEAYSPKADFRIDAVLLRDQITARAKNVLLVLLAASGLVFVIACSNVANLILARTVRREGELAVRAALGASRRMLRRMLLAESLLLCGMGAALGVAIAGPMVSVLSRYAARFSVRALDITLDSTLLWVGAALAIAAAVLLAFVPRLPASDATHGLGVASGGLRVTGGTSQRLRAFAVTQIAASFILLAGAGMLVHTLLTLQAASTGFETRQVLAINVPVMSYGRTPDQIRAFYREVQQRVGELPGVERVAVGSTVPWRDGTGGTTRAFTLEGATSADDRDQPRAKFRSVSPGFFATLGIPIIAGRDFTEADRNGAERVVIVSETLARQLLPEQEALNRHLTWTDGIMKFIGVSMEPRRIVGIVPDVDDEHVDPVPSMTVYHPAEQEAGFGRLFVHARTDPYALVAPITQIVRALAAEQPVEHPSTLEDVRAEVLAPTRLNAIVFGGFSAVALAIAAVGVAGVLAFSVSGRTREFGVRLAVGSHPRHLLAGVLAEGTLMATVGIFVGAAGGFVLGRVAATYIQDLEVPGFLPVLGAAVVLLISAVVASALPAVRAARVDVMQALRAE
jgi:predicted permease